MNYRADTTVIFPNSENLHPSAYGRTEKEALKNLYSRLETDFWDLKHTDITIHEKTDCSFNSRLTAWKLIKTIKEG